MNVYDSHRMADVWRRPVSPKPRSRTTPTSSSSIPATSARRRRTRFIPNSAACALLKHAGGAGGGRKVTDRGRRLRRAGRRRGDRPARAAASISWSARRIITACRRCSRAPSAASRSSIPNFRPKTVSRRCRRASREVTRARGISAFVTVQEGCDKFCTFCVVPYTRGVEISRPVEQICAEVERLAAAGVREVTLIGQNVNAYHGHGADGREWPLGKSDAPARRCARHRAAALHDQPSAATWTTA